MRSKATTDSAAPAVEGTKRLTTRRPAMLVWVVILFIAGAFSVLTYLIMTTSSFATDLQITQVVQRAQSPAFAWLMQVISWPGFTPQVEFLAGLMILALVGLGLRWEAVVALSAALLSTAINLLVKELIHRPRPASGQVNVFAALTTYSFPSGHVMFYVIFFGFFGYLALYLLKPSAVRSFLLLIPGSLIALIGLSRIYLGEHWASDVLGAYLLGSLMLVAVVQFYQWGKALHLLHQPHTGYGSHYD